MDCIVHGVAKSQTRLSDFHFHCFYWASLWLSGKESTCNAGDAGEEGSIPRLGGSPEGGNGNPLQYSCLGNPMYRGPGGLQSTGLQPKGLSI